MNLRTITTLLVLALFLSFSAQSVEARGIKGAGQKSKGESGKSDKDSAKSKSKAKPFAKLIKDKVKIEGLFTFYHDTVDNSVLMAINPEHFGPIYLFGSARSTGDGTFYDAGYPSRTFPLYFKRVGLSGLIMKLDINSTLLQESWQENPGNGKKPARQSRHFKYYVQSCRGWYFRPSFYFAGHKI